jgi:polar amino acid transport system substrate-binding protein
MEKDVNRLVLAALALAALTLGANADPIKLATEGAYPPFNFVDDSGKVGGFDVDLGNELCKRAKLECTWVVNEWDSLIPNLIAGNFDAILADMTITDDRKQTINFTEPYFPPDPSTYMSAAGKAIDYTKLSGLKIGVQTGTVQATWADQNIKAGNTIVSYATDDQMVADLKAGNLDMFLAEGSYIGEQVAASAGAFKADGPQIPIGLGAGVGLRKADTDLQTKLDAALAEVKADGWLDAQIVKYFPNMGPGPFFKK